MALTGDALQKAKEQYPSLAYLLDNPEVSGLIERSINESWPSGKLQLEITKTDWWKHTSPSMRQWSQDRAMDPAKTEEQLRTKQAQIQDMWMRLGGENRAAGDPWIADVATKALSMGWDDSQLNDFIVSTFTDRPNITPPTGSIGVTMNQLTDLGSQWGVKIDNHTAFNWARSVAAGERTVDDWGVLIREQSKGRFPTLQKYIDQGISPSQFFASYKQQIGGLLEQDPQSVDLLNDPKWSKVIATTDKDGTQRPMTLSEAATYTRGLDDYKKTAQGQEAAATMGETILKTFGKRAS